MIRRAVIPGLATLFLLVACGGGGTSPPPMHPDQAESDASAANDPPSHPGDAGAPTSAAEVDAGAAASSSPPPPPPPSDIIANKTDECTPVGIDLEKRARPKIKECYREGKKNEKDLKGTVKIAIDIDSKGKVRSIKVTENTLPEAMANCMLKAVKGTPFPEASKCPGHGITIPVTFPTPH